MIIPACLQLKKNHLIGLENILNLKVYINVAMKTLIHESDTCVCLVIFSFTVENKFFYDDSSESSSSHSDVRHNYNAQKYYFCIQ